jgi:hypothetical protein
MSTLPPVEGVVAVATGVVPVVGVLVATLATEVAVAVGSSSPPQATARAIVPPSKTPTIVLNRRDRLINQHFLLRRVGFPEHRARNDRASTFGAALAHVYK